MTAWLTDAELADLSGYKTAARQRAWLERNGFAERADYFCNAAGKPRLLRAALDPRLPISAATSSPPRAAEPNLAAIT
jgi:hypothetical protein